MGPPILRTILINRLKGLVTCSWWFCNFLVSPLVRFNTNSWHNYIYQRYMIHHSRCSKTIRPDNFTQFLSVNPSPFGAQSKTTRAKYTNDKSGKENGFVLNIYMYTYVTQHSPDQLLQRCDNTAVWHQKWIGIRHKSLSMLTDTIPNLVRGLREIFHLRSVVGPDHLLLLYGTWI